MTFMYFSRFYFAYDPPDFGSPDSLALLADNTVNPLIADTSLLFTPVNRILFRTEHNVSRKKKFITNNFNHKNYKKKYKILNVWYVS